MNPKDIKFFRQFFREYVKKFYSDAEIDAQIKINMKLKQAHTYLVYRNILFLSKSLNLKEEEINLAKAIALFHDIGNEKDLFFCRLLRDADKIDIFRVWIDYFERKSGYDPSYGMDLSVSNECSVHIISDILANKISPLEKVKTYNDIKLLLLTWIYDVHFDASLNLILKRKYIREIFKILPKNKEIEKVCEHINFYISER
ncbi:MAG: hypothetical protein CVT89_06330 [Candidatus Altiarchaeales archaeon HGW-Altiarchaeales-2]|nr:MAG: hypothetical protein CVT89_06330 [Candidatus Altiarchaeales archaeon HGW-Altiarchaeales-2]